MQQKTYPVIEIDYFGGSNVKLFNANNRLYMLKNKIVVEVVPTSHIDPDNKNLDTKTITRKILDFGTEDDLVYKTICVVDEILQKTPLEVDVEEQSIKNCFFDIMLNIAHMKNIFTGIFYY